MSVNTTNDGSGTKISALQCEMYVFKCVPGKNQTGVYSQCRVIEMGGRDVSNLVRLIYKCFTQWGGGGGGGGGAVRESQFS